MLALGAWHFDGVPHLDDIEPVGLECAVRECKRTGAVA
jgi:hypothetical protein